MKRDAPRLAIPEFRSRVAPVLNWCSKIYVFSEASAEHTSSPDSGQEIVLLEMNAFDRLRLLHERGVRTIICGALSPDLLSYGESLGIKIIHGVAGDIVDVLRAYHTQDLDQPCFRLPGCRGPRRYRRAWTKGCPAGSAVDEAGSLPSQSGGGGKERVGAHCEAMAGQVEVRKTGGLTSGPGGFCVCPQCGAKVEHERGIPCAQMVCPHCGSPMVRE